MSPRKTAPATARTAAGPSAQGILATLKARFEAHPHRHPGLAWAYVAAQLDARALTVLARMEDTGGEPDVVCIEGPSSVVFVDCATQSPAGRRSLCFDREAWQSRKEARPSDTVQDMSAALGATLLTEQDYRALQSVEAFDTTTSSWIATPPDIRAAGGALFCDRRYGHVFTYHNGAQSYYAARGFRAKLRLARHPPNE